MRFNGFDLLRILCVAGVVWIHGCDTSALALRLSGNAAFAVPAFVLMSFFLLQLSVLKNPEERPVTLLAKRFKRLGPAYLAWSVAYWIVRGIKQAVLGNTFSVAGIVSALLTGGASYQLYFVAALMYWMLLFVPFLFFLRNKPYRSAVFLLILIFFVCAVLNPGIRISAPIRRLSCLSYGIFLVHGFFVEGFQMVYSRAGLDLAQFGPTLILIVLSFACSYGVCEVFVRIRKLEWLVV